MATYPFPFHTSYPSQYIVFVNKDSPPPTSKPPPLWFRLADGSEKTAEDMLGSTAVDILGKQNPLSPEGILRTELSEAVKEHLGPDHDDAAVAALLRTGTGQTVVFGRSDRKSWLNIGMARMGGVVPEESSHAKEESSRVFGYRMSNVFFDDFGKKGFFSSQEQQKRDLLFSEGIDIRRSLFPFVVLRERQVLCKIGFYWSCSWLF